MQKLMLLAVFAALCACKSPRTNVSAADGDKWLGKPYESLGVGIIWVKHRGDEVHMYMKVHNDGETEIALRGDWCTMKTAGLTGTPRKKPPTLVLGAGERKGVLIQFQFGKNVPKQGDVDVTVQVDEPKTTLEYSFWMRK